MPLSPGKMARYAAVGSELFTPIIAGALVGHYLDEHFRTEPWLTLVMFLLGVAASFYNLVRVVARFQKDMKG